MRRRPSGSYGALPFIRLAQKDIVAPGLRNVRILRTDAEERQERTPQHCDRYQTVPGILTFPSHVKHRVLPFREAPGFRGKLQSHLAIAAEQWAERTMRLHAPRTPAGVPAGAEGRRRSSALIGHSTILAASGAAVTGKIGRLGAVTERWRRSCLRASEAHRSMRLSASILAQ